VDKGTKHTKTVFLSVTWFPVEIWGIAFPFLHFLVKLENKDVRWRGTRTDHIAVYFGGFI
jgi:hypothetical protein